MLITKRKALETSQIYAMRQGLSIRMLTSNETDVNDYYIESVSLTLASIFTFVILLVGGLLLLWALLRKQRARASQFTSRPTLVSKFPISQFAPRFTPRTAEALV
ncbi:hypothetical protein BASA81_011315 [Batrachochytrium salamandrivorans]|nr:hypothetical protein BASA81_011315 [Batrachochytrium salamandrivorans]